MSVLITGPLLLAFTWGTGYAFLKNCPLSGAERHWLAPLLGFALLTAVAALLCFTGLLTPLWILVALSLVAAGAVGFRISAFAGMTNRKEGASPPQEGLFVCPPAKRLVVSLCIVVGVHTLLCALTPEVRSDPVRYHISMANQYAVRGGIEPLRETVWWSIPQYAECLYAMGIAISNDTLAKIFHWWAGAIATMGVFALADRWFGRGPAWWATLLWVTTPKVSYEMTTTYVDLVLVIWIQFSVWAAARALSVEEPRSAARWMALSGLGMGLGFGTKYTAMGVQGIPWLLFPAVAISRYWGSGWRTRGLFLCSFFAVALGDFPWLLRNLWNTGNPIYPLYNRLFGLVGEADRASELYFLTVWPGVKSLTGPFFYLERLEGFLHSGYNFPGIVLLLIVVLLAKCRAGGIRLNSGAFPLGCVLGFCMVSLSAYVVLTGNMDGRFWLPTLAVFLPFLGWGLDIAPEVLAGSDPVRGARIGRFFAAALVLLCIYNYVGQRAAFFRDFEESPWPILSEEARRSYYRDHERGDPDGWAFEELVPKGQLVYGIGFPHRIRSISPVIETVVDRDGRRIRSNEDPLIDPFMESARTPEDLLRIAAEARIGFVVLPIHANPQPEEFWETVRTTCQPMSPSGSLLRIPVENHIPRGRLRLVSERGCKEAQSRPQIGLAQRNPAMAL
jgi:hypothetical protein